MAITTIPQMPNKLSTLQKIERIHPHLMILYLFMLGSGLIFLFLTLAFTWSFLAQKPSLPLPRAFTFSTVILLTSGFVQSRALSLFELDEFAKLKQTLLLVAILGGLFVLFQTWGWVQLMQLGVFLNGHASGGYLYIISGLHLLHMLVAYILLAPVLKNVVQANNDPVRQLIISTNPYQKIRLRMFSTYWHFVDLLWIALFFILQFII